LQKGRRRCGQERKGERGGGQEREEKKGEAAPADGLGPSSPLSFITSGHYTLPPIREFVLEFSHFYDRNQHNGKTDLTS